MSRKEYLDKLSPEAKKQIEEIKKTNAAVMQQNAVIKNINTDIKTVIQDFSDAIAAKDLAVKIAKYQDAETIMLRDTAAKPDASTLWAQLGQAQAGLGCCAKRHHEIRRSDRQLEESPGYGGRSQKAEWRHSRLGRAALGEIYARTGKVPDANAGIRRRRQG